METPPAINPESAEVIASSLEEIARGMKAIDATRLNRAALIVLLQHTTKLSRKALAKVLDDLGNLERNWLKPKKLK